MASKKAELEFKLKLELPGLDDITLQKAIKLLESGVTIEEILRKTLEEERIREMASFQKQANLEMQKQKLADQSLQDRILENLFDGYGQVNLKQVKNAINAGVIGDVAARLAPKQARELLLVNQDAMHLMCQYLNGLKNTGDEMADRIKLRHAIDHNLRSVVDEAHQEELAPELKLQLIKGAIVASLIYGAHVEFDRRLGESFGHPAVITHIADSINQAKMRHPDGYAMMRVNFVRMNSAHPERIMHLVSEMLDDERQSSMLIGALHKDGKLHDVARSLGDERFTSAASKYETQSSSEIGKFTQAVTAREPSGRSRG